MISMFLTWHPTVLFGYHCPLQILSVMKHHGAYSLKDMPITDFVRGWGEAPGVQEARCEVLHLHQLAWDFDISQFIKTK